MGAVITAAANRPAVVQVPQSPPARPSSAASITQGRGSPISATRLSATSRSRR